jgi:nitrite reductase/ring-hydroxylating ferredoxin subunit
MSTEFIKICKESDIPNNRRGKLFIVGDDAEVAVFKVNGKIYVVSNVCPHNHSNVMYEGYVDEGLYVACPIHGWQFSLETGLVPPHCTELSAKLENYKTKIENGDLYVEAKKSTLKFWNW